MQVREEATLRLDVGMRNVVAGCGTFTRYLAHS